MNDNDSLQKSGNQQQGSPLRADALARRGLGDLIERHNRWTLRRVEHETKLRGVDNARMQLQAGVALNQEGDKDTLAAYEHILDLDSHYYRMWTPDKEPAGFLQVYRNRARVLGLARIVEDAESLLDERRTPHVRLATQPSLESPGYVRSLHPAATRSGFAISPDGKWAACGLSVPSDLSGFRPAVGV
ncbi:MAG: hypothetical protein IT318_08620 [Anaerolineales bacterium]|nr:hypothetical protein [Anaerolineales bacterium]